MVWTVRRAGAVLRAHGQSAAPADDPTVVDTEPISGSDDINEKPVFDQIEVADIVVIIDQESGIVFASWVAAGAPLSHGCEPCPGTRLSPKTREICHKKHQWKMS